MDSVALQHMESSWAGMEPVSPALTGGLLTTGPPRMSERCSVDDKKKLKHSHPSRSQEHTAKECGEDVGGRRKALYSLWVCVNCKFLEPKDWPYSLHITGGE